MGEGGVSPCHIFLCRWRPYCINGTGLAAGRVKNPHCFFWQSGSPKNFREYSWYALPTLPLGREPVGGGLRAVDDRRGTNIPGPTETMVSVPWLWHRPGNRVSGGPPSYAACIWSGSGSSVGEPPPTPPPPEGEPHTYRIYLPIAAGTRDCPIERCRKREAIGLDLHMHFLHRNVQDTVVILYEGTYPPSMVPHNVIWWCLGYLWTAATPTPPSAPRGRSINGVGWQQRICGRARRGNFRYTAGNWPRWNRSNTLTGSWQTQTMNGQQWWGT